MSFHRPVVAAAFAALLLPVVASSGCTLLWVFNSDPAGLPCEFTDEDPVGRCLQGYTCVGGKCEEASAKPAGTPCARSEECEDGLACATAFTACTDEGDNDDVNCALLAEEETDLQCRTICEKVDDTACTTDERCYLLNGVEGVPGICQPGTCATDTECNAIDGSTAVCGGVFKDGLVGLCQETCNPLTCAVNGTCTGCDGLDNAPDNGLNCIPQPDTPVQAQRFICDAAGSTPDFAACGDVGQDLCRLGAFCVNFNGANYCAPWCAVSGGNPQCPAETACQSIDGVIGFCG